MVGTAVFLGWNTRVAVVRYNVDGTLDTSFGGDGKVDMDLARGPDHASGVAMQADGRIVVVGGSRTRQRDERFALMRYRSG